MTIEIFEFFILSFFIRLSQAHTIFLCIMPAIYSVYEFYIHFLHSTNAASKAVFMALYKCWSKEINCI